MNETLLSIVIPCLNEEKTLPVVLEKAQSSIKKLKISGEIIVADNGSTDKSIEIAKKHHARVVNVPHKGYGNALIGGMTAARGKYLLMGDADDSYNFLEIEEFINEIKKHDLVIGTRLKGEIKKGAMPFLHRYLGTPVLTFILNLLFKTKISDCNCGMRCLSKEAFTKMKMESAGMEFASEMMIKAGLLKLRIKEIPITLYPDKRDRKPHLNTWRDGWRHLRFMFLYSPNYLFKIPGIILTLIGFGILVLLSGGPVEIKGITLDYHSAILGSLLTIVGTQIFSVGIYAKLLAYYQPFSIKDRFIEKLLKHFSLEKGLLFGLAVFLFGLIRNVFVVVEWANLGFQNLNEAGTVAFASTLMVVGLQIIFSSFFLSIIKK